MSAAGCWDRWYTDTDDASVYGDPTTYRLGAGWLERCELVEDWGCGKGGLTLFRDRATIRGIDGSPTRWADIVADLASYRSSTPGLFMRHVLEHNYAWATILANALGSFTDRMALVIFTPPATTTGEIAFAADPGVPDIAFAPTDLARHFEAAGARWRAEQLETATQYGVETIVYLEKR